MSKEQIPSRFPWDCPWDFPLDFPWESLREIDLRVRPESVSEKMEENLLISASNSSSCSSSKGEIIGFWLELRFEREFGFGAFAFKL